MHTNVYIHVYMYMYMYIYIYTYICICICIYIYVCMYVWMYVCIYILKHTHTFTHIHRLMSCEDVPEMTSLAFMLAVRSLLALLVQKYKCWRRWGRSGRRVSSGDVARQRTTPYGGRCPSPCTSGIYAIHSRHLTATELQQSCNRAATELQQEEADPESLHLRYLAYMLW